jgi:TPP-dependent 2-oxoacid decarboxylase
VDVKVKPAQAMAKNNKNYTFEKKLFRKKYEKWDVQPWGFQSLF